MADTVEFPQEHKNIPRLSTKEVATNPVLNLLETLAKPVLEASFAPIGAAKLQALRQLAEFFKQQTDQTKPIKN